MPAPAARQLLIVASQCDEMPDLSFLPERDYRPGAPVPGERHLVFDLYEQLVDPGPGMCHPVAGLDAIDGLPLAAAGLVINPTQSQANAALVYAINIAAGDSAVLLVYYLGHGHQYEDPDEPLAQEAGNAAPRTRAPFVFRLYQAEESHPHRGWAVRPCAQNWSRIEPGAVTDPEAGEARPRSRFAVQPHSSPGREAVG